MPHCVLLLRMRCYVRADAGSDGELHRDQEQEGACGVSGDAVLQLSSRVENTDHSLTLPSLRSWSSNELPGIDRAFISPSLFPPEEKKIHMSPAIYGLLHTRYHTWISYPVGVSAALSWFDEATVFVCSCRSTRGGPGESFIYARGSSFSGDRWFPATLMCVTAA